jgi:hypothetical protein
VSLCVRTGGLPPPRRVVCELRHRLGVVLVTSNCDLPPQTWRGEPGAAVRRWSPRSSRPALVFWMAVGHRDISAQLRAFSDRPDHAAQGRGPARSDTQQYRTAETDAFERQPASEGTGRSGSMVAGDAAVAQSSRTTATACRANPVRLRRRARPVAGTNARVDRFTRPAGRARSGNKQVQAQIDRASLPAK